MGIHINLAVVIRDWLYRHRLTGPSLTLGVQDINFTRIEYESRHRIRARCHDVDAGSAANDRR